MVSQADAGVGSPDAGGTSGLDASGVPDAGERLVVVSGRLLGLGYPGEPDWSEATVVVQPLYRGTAGATASADLSGAFEVTLPTPEAEDVTIVVMALRADSPYEHHPLFSIAEISGGRVSLSLPPAVGAEVTPADFERSAVELSGLTSAAAMAHLISPSTLSLQDRFSSALPYLERLENASEDRYRATLASALADYATSLTGPRIRAPRFAAGDPATNIANLQDLASTCAEALTTINQGLLLPVKALALWTPILLARLAIHGVQNEVNPDWWRGAITRTPITSQRLLGMARVLEGIGVGNCQQHAFLCAAHAAAELGWVEQLSIVAADGPRSLTNPLGSGHAFVLLTDLTPAELDLSQVIAIPADADGCYDESGTVALGVLSFCTDSSCNQVVGVEALSPEQSRSLYVLDSWAADKGLPGAGIFTADYLTEGGLDRMVTNKPVVLDDRANETPPQSGPDQLPPARCSNCDVCFDCASQEVPVPPAHACTSDPRGPPDAGPQDASCEDAEVEDADIGDAAPRDSGRRDGGRPRPDAGRGPPDAAPLDAEPLDAGITDAGLPDTGASDAGLPPRPPRNLGGTAAACYNESADPTTMPGGRNCALAPPLTVPVLAQLGPLAPPGTAYAGCTWRIARYFDEIDEPPGPQYHPAPPDEIVATGTVSAAGALLGLPTTLDFIFVGSANPTGSGHDVVRVDYNVDVSCDGLWPPRTFF